MIPVILSGGSGSRLWPLSRKQFPKQFLALTGEDTLFQQTIKRLRLPGMQPPLLVCNQEHRFIVQEQLKEQQLETQATLLEPFGRNTAPAVAIAAMKLLAEGRDELLLILPADHVLEDQAAFEAALQVAQKAAENGGRLPQNPGHHEQQEYQQRPFERQSCEGAPSDRGRMIRKGECQPGNHRDDHGAEIGTDASFGLQHGVRSLSPA